MAIIQTRRQKVWSVFKYIFIIGLMLFTMLPLIYMVSSAFKPMEELFVFPPKFIVKRPTLQNFAMLGSAVNTFMVPFSRYIFNSLFVTVVTVVLSTIVCSMGAFSLSKYRFFGSKFIFTVIIAALMFTAQVTQIPSYLIISGMHLTNNYLALILPKIAVASNIFLVKQFIDQLPDTLLESARLDGAGEMYIYWKIIMPLSKPAWTTLIMFSFLGTWNDSFSPMIYMTDEQMKTITLAIQNIGTSVARAGAVAVASLILTLPTIILFIILQKQIMETMVYSGIKG